MPGGCRRWMFTWNNFPAGQEQMWLNDAAPPPEIRYAIWQHECGAENHVHHIQGYVVFKTPLSVGTVKHIVGDPAHLDKCKGTDDDCVAYCTKEDTRIAGPWHIGERVAQGERTDLAALAALVKEGKTDRDLAEIEPCTFMRHYKGLQTLRMVLLPPLEREVTTFCLCGPTGIGKSWAMRRCFEVKGPIYQVNWDRAGTPWFDGYQGEKTIIFDDFSGAIPIEHMLHMLDRYPYRAPIKGGFVNAQWSTVLLTCNDPPATWYPVASLERQAALMRRLTHNWIADSRHAIQQLLAIQFPAAAQPPADP